MNHIVEKRRDLFWKLQREKRTNEKMVEQQGPRAGPGARPSCIKKP